MVSARPPSPLWPYSDCRPSHEFQKVYEIWNVTQLVRSSASRCDRSPLAVVGKAPPTARWRQLRPYSIALAHIPDSIYPNKSRTINHNRPLLPRNLLKIYRLYTCHFSDYLRFICAFRHLETLVIDHPFWERRDSDFSLSTLRLPSTLRALELKDNGEHIIMEWLLTLETLPPLRTLYQHEIFEPENVRLLGKLLPTLGPSLEAVSYTYCGTENSETVNLSHNTSLRSIHLGIFTTDEGTTELDHGDLVANRFSVYGQGHLQVDIPEL